MPGRQLGRAWLAAMWPWLRHPILGYRMRRAIESLPQPTLECLLLKARGFTLSQIAARTGLDSQTVARLVAEGIQTVQQQHPVG